MSNTENEGPTGLWLRSSFEDDAKSDVPASIHRPPPWWGDLEPAGGGAEANADLPEQVGLVLGQQVLHDDLVGRGHARVFEDDAEPGVGAAGRGVPDFDEAVRPARNAVVLVAVLDGHAVELAELVKLLGFDDVADELRGNQLGHALVVCGRIQGDRLVASGLRRALALDDPEDLGLDKPGIARPQRGAGDDELGERRGHAHHLVGERAGLALELFHPVANHARPVGCRVAKLLRTDVGDGQLDLASAPVECSEDRIIRGVAPDELLGGLDMPGSLDPDNPVRGASQENDFARLGIHLAADVVDLDLPAQVSGPDHDLAARCEYSWPVPRENR